MSSPPVDDSSSPSARLFEAIRNGHLAAVKALVAKHSSALLFVAQTPSTALSPLHLAALYHRADIVEYVLSAGVSPNAKTHTAEGWTPLCLCMRRNNQATASPLLVPSILIAAGADVNMRCSTGLTPLAAAALAESSSTDLLQLLVAKGADVGFVEPRLSTSGEPTHEFARTAMCLGAGIGNTDAVALLLDLKLGKRRRARMLLKHLRRRSDEHPANTRSAPDDERMLDSASEMLGHEAGCALLSAASNGHLETITFLLDAGVDVNYTDEDGWTGLHFAVHGDQMDAVALLAQRGANINQLTHRKLSPLIVATMRGLERMLRALVHLGADKDVLGPGEATALGFAVQSGNEEMVRVLLDLGCQVSIKKTFDGIQMDMCPVWRAATDGRLGIVQLLVERGANVDIRKGRLLKPMLASASEMGHRDVVEYLLQHGASPHLADMCGRTAIHYAAMNGFVHIVKNLVASGASVDSQSCDFGAIS